MKTFLAWLETMVPPIVDQNQERKATDQAVKAIANDPATSKLRSDLAAGGPDNVLRDKLLKGTSMAMQKVGKIDPTILKQTNANNVAVPLAKEMGVDLKRVAPNLAKAALSKGVNFNNGV
jgi:hypothetical protein